MSMRFDPTSAHRFFSYDGDEGFAFFATKRERDEHAAERIRSYLEDDRWHPEVESVITGEVTHTAQKCDVQHRPPDDELDEEGIDGEGDYWEEDVDYRCNYRLMPLENPDA